MLLIIDGYNFIYQLGFSPTAPIAERDRLRYIALLGRYARIKGLKIMIVFDGGGHQWPLRELTDSIVVVYSGQRETADDYIKHYMQEHDQDDILLISSDRELRLFADSLKIISLSSPDFYHYLDNALKPLESRQNTRDATIVKTTTRENKEVDALMYESFYEKINKPGVDSSEKIAYTKKGEKLSKTERTMLQKLKKL